MIPVRTTHPYTAAGLFAAVRKYDIHTGLDLYCDAFTPVYCIEDGVVLEVIHFTGADAGSPWWNDTHAIAVQLADGTVHVYGEVQPAVQPRQQVIRGQVLGSVIQVLVRDKGVNPPCMLHLEVWTKNYQSNHTWAHGEPVPSGLVNPIELFCFWVIKTASGYKIETHQGHYWKYFSSAIDCKSYCMSRADEFGEKYCYINSEQLKQNYALATGKVLQQYKY